MHDFILAQYLQDQHWLDIPPLLSALSWRTCSIVAISFYWWASSTIRHHGRVTTLEHFIIVCSMHLPRILMPLFAQTQPHKSPLVTVYSLYPRHMFGQSETSVLKAFRSRVVGFITASTMRNRVMVSPTSQFVHCVNAINIPQSMT